MRRGITCLLRPKPIDKQSYLVSKPSKHHKEYTSKALYVRMNSDIGCYHKRGNIVEVVNETLMTGPREYKDCLYLYIEGSHHYDVITDVEIDSIDISSVFKNDLKPQQEPNK